MARRLQLLFIFGVAAISLFFSCRLSGELFTYLSLRENSPAKILQWEISEIEDRFALKAVYSFKVQGKIWKGTGFLQKPYYWNEPAALAALKTKAKEEWVVWYDASNPARSSLEKKFPAGLLFRTIICYGVLVYFFFLRNKISKIIIN